VQWLQGVIGGPRECLGVSSLDAWQNKAKTMRVRMGLSPALRTATRKQPAHVSVSRWVFDCPCGSAGLASHEWGVGICVDCGVIHPVSFPDDRAEVEAVLLDRPVQNRHYFPARETATRRGFARGERLADITGENEIRGVRRRGGD
jgi:hypothetical protein